MSRDEYAEDLHAELGYRTTGQREVRQREWFSLRGEAYEPLPTPKAFKSAVNVLMAKRWKAANPERARELNRRWANRHADQKAAQVKRWRHRKTKGRVFICAASGCEVSWCRVPFGRLNGGNIRPKYCSVTCRNRARTRRAAERRKAAQATDTTTPVGKGGDRG